MIEMILIAAIVIFIALYRKNANGSVNTFVKEEWGKIYARYAPYSYKVIKQKVKELGLDYSVTQYVFQVLMFAGFAAIISYLYFYNIWVTIVYVLIAVLAVPYVSYMRMKRIYSEYIFEQVQVYTTNVIMEFETTQSFVKSLEGVYSSGVLEEPIKSDVKMMIDMAYQQGSIDEAIKVMNEKYPYHIVKNMHQLFLQITKEGALQNNEVLDNMLLDIDMLVENVYRDRSDRKTFHGSFIKYGIMLYFLIALIQYLLTTDTYIQMIQKPFIFIMLNVIVIFNTVFLFRGEKYYNENVGVE